MSDKILTANLKTWRWDPDQTPLSWHEDEIYTLSHFWEPSRPHLRSPGCHSLLLLSSHNIVLQCDIKYLQDESASWYRRVCDPYLGIDSRPCLRVSASWSLVGARDQAKAGAMRTLGRNARHSDRRLSYSDSLLSHAQNLTFVLGHYIPNSSLRNIFFFAIPIVFSKLTLLIICHCLWCFFLESESINKLCWTFGQQINHLNEFVCSNLNKSLDLFHAAMLSGQKNLVLFDISDNYLIFLIKVT